MHNEKNQSPDNTRYVGKFLGLKCAGDVLNVVYPVNNIQKEISEAMSVIKHLRSITMDKPRKYEIYDMCAGNALASVLAAHLLPIKKATAIDLNKRDRNWDNAKRFIYLSGVDIHKMNIDMIKKDSIIIAIHACSGLAKRIIEIYVKSKAKHLIMLPCCAGKVEDNIIPDIFKEAIGKHSAWAWKLSKMCNGKLYRDDKCTSARNIIIRASK